MAGGWKLQGRYAVGSLIEHVRDRAARKQRLGDRWRVFWSEEEQ